MMFKLNLPIIDINQITVQAVGGVGHGQFGLGALKADGADEVAEPSLFRRLDRRLPCGSGSGISTMMPLRIVASLDACQAEVTCHAEHTGVSGISADAGQARASVSSPRQLSQNPDDGQCMFETDGLRFRVTARAPVD